MVDKRPLKRAFFVRRLVRGVESPLMQSTGPALTVLLAMLSLRYNAVVQVNEGVYLTTRFTFGS